MTKEEYREKYCISCVNYEYKRRGEKCSKFVYEEGKLYCKNYRKWTECIKKSCRECGKCDGNR